MALNTFTTPRPAFAFTGQAPALTSIPTHHTHTDVGGFCNICGSVWPCAKARSTDRMTVHIPVPR